MRGNITHIAISIYHGVHYNDLHPRLNFSVEKSCLSVYLKKIDLIRDVFFVLFFFLCISV